MKMLVLVQSQSLRIALFMVLAIALLGGCKLDDREQLAIILVRGLAFQ